MALAQELIGLGFPPFQAAMMGDSQTEALTATGINQAGALVLSNTINIVTTTAASTGVALPPANTNLQNPRLVILNLGANTLSAYGNPNNSDTINNVAGSTAFSIPANQGAVFRRNNAGNGWFAASQGF